MIHGIGVFTLDAFAVAIWAVIGAITLAVTFSNLYNARTHGRDTDLNSIPTIGGGLVLGAVIGGVAAFMQLSSGSFITNMFGCEAVFAILCIIAVRVARKAYR